MIKPTGLSMAIVMAATAAGTYYALEMLPPGLIPPPIGRVVSVGPAPLAAPTPAVVAAAAPAPAPAAETPPAPAPEAPADELAKAPDVAPIQARAPAPVPEAAPAKPAKPAPESEPAAAEPQSATTPAEAPQGTAAASATVTAAPEADVIKPWWPDPSTMPANQLKLQYAGQVQGQRAIALLFTAPLKLETVQQNVTVRTAGGETVAGEWTIGKNPKLAVLGGLAPGRYTVILQPQVADQQGFMLGATLSGPVYVKP